MGFAMLAEVRRKGQSDLVKSAYEELRPFSFSRLSRAGGNPYGPATRRLP